MSRENQGSVADDVEVVQSPARRSLRRAGLVAAFTGMALAGCSAHRGSSESNDINVDMCGVTVQPAATSDVLKLTCKVDPASEAEKLTYTLAYQADGDAEWLLDTATPSSNGTFALTSGRCAISAARLLYVSSDRYFDSGQGPDFVTEFTHELGGKQLTAGKPPVTPQELIQAGQISNCA